MTKNPLATIAPLFDPERPRRTPRSKKSSTDLGSRTDELTLHILTDAQAAENARLASQMVSREPDGAVILEMLGLTSYRSGKRPQRVPAGPLVHGKRSTYSNHGCRCTECVEANSAYFTESYRAA